MGGRSSPVIQCYLVNCVGVGFLEIHVTAWKMGWRFIGEMEAASSLTNLRVFFLLFVSEVLVYFEEHEVVPTPILAKYDAAACLPSQETPYKGQKQSRYHSLHIVVGIPYYSIIIPHLRGRGCTERAC